MRRARRRVDSLTTTAYHEAGHAALSAAISDTPQYVTIRPDGHTLGRSRAMPSHRPTTRVQVLLAGYAAEHLLTGRRTRQFDRDVGFAIISRLDPSLRAAFQGVEESDGHRAVEQILGMDVPGTDDEIRVEVDRFYEISRLSLAAVWPTVSALAAALLVREELDRDGIDEAIGGVDIYRPVFAVQRAHGLLLVAATPATTDAHG
jgi:hypothetical protein